MSLIRLLLGRPLASDEQENAKIGVFSGLSAMGLDGLSSAAYGPEAALVILVPLGAAGLNYIGPIMLAILLLLGMLYLSYRQTIEAYPENGGSYTVARENLGTWAGRLAAAALMIDYILNAAVGISAGIAAVVSAFPAMERYTVPLCLVVLALITAMNLRGTAEAGVAFALPTYLFIASLLTVLAIGAIRTVLSHGNPAPLTPPVPPPAVTGSVGLWILLRSFASGCSAMTGVEAVSNGVSAFKEPRVKTAHRTLTAIVGMLAILLAGVAFVAKGYHIAGMRQDASNYQSTLSQVVGAVVGRGWFYYLTMGSVLLVLCLSANTSFVGFPRLCRLVARDGYLPIYFAAIGRRLVFSTGVLFLAIASGILIVAFKGVTDDLIPLFAVGAFTAFALSQAGMVVHWVKKLKGSAPSRPGEKTINPYPRLIINGIGAVATGAALAIILVAKFAEGAWITILTVPLILALFRLVHHHYKVIEGVVRCDSPLEVNRDQPPVMLVPVRGWTQPVHKAMRFALRMSPDVVAVHLNNLEGDAGDDETARFREEWAKQVETPARSAGVPPPKLFVAQTPYREFVQPLLVQIDRIKSEYPGRLVAVVIPELVERNWLESILFTHKAARLRRALHGRADGRVVVIDLPWFVGLHGANGEQGGADGKQ